MATVDDNVIPIIKLSNNNGSYYPLSVPESVYTTHEYEVMRNIGSYKKGDIVDPLTTLDEIITNILGSLGDFNGANFIGVTSDDPGANDGYPPQLTLDNGDIYTSDDYSEGDLIIYNSPEDASNVLCVFYKKNSDPHGKWLVISDDILYVGDENHPPPERSKKKVLWLDTTTKTIDTYTDSPEMESIKNLIYKLMMAYGKVVKLVENGIKPTDAGGVIPGTEVSNWRKELIDAAEPEQPIDIIPSSELDNITIYGNDYTGSGSIYRALFTPNGFTDKQVTWTFANGTKKTPLKDESGKTLGYAEIHADASTQLEKPECELELYLWDAETETKYPIVYTGIVDTAIELVATYNLDPYAGENEIVATKTIKVGGEKPETDVEPTVKSICIKMDTSENFVSHKEDLVDGELLFYTDKAKFVVYRYFKNSKGVYTEKFYTLQTDDSEAQGLTEDQLYELALKYLKFKDSFGNVYKVYCNSDGKWQLKKYETEYSNNNDDESYAYAGTASRYLSMGTIYCGGNSKTEGKVSHNFVEIYNSRLDGKSFNLGGMFLMYTDCTVYTGSTGYVWYVLPLEGVIKAGSTFTVRGARSNTDDASFIKVDHYDQEWFSDDDKTKLIEFNVNKGAFYLINGENVEGERVLPSDIRTQLANHTFVGFSSSTMPVGYVDGFGFRNLVTTSGVPCEKSPLDLSPSNVVSTSDPNCVTADQCIFTKNFILDPSKQALKVYTSKNTTSLWTFIKFDKQTEKLGNSIQYYWPDSIKKTYTPGNVEDNHNFYNYGRSKFDSKKPNCINITFGIQATATVNYKNVVDHEGIKYYQISGDVIKAATACSEKAGYNNLFVKTDNGLEAQYTTKRKYASYTVNNDASRCFNWISVGNYDEYIEYRKQGETEWTRMYSIIAKDRNDSDSMIYKNETWVDAPFIDFYKRYTWATGYDGVWVTTHKRIIRGLTSGTYEYRIGRDDDESYTTPTKTFVVKNDAEVTSFKFAQVTDQQGFNWSEYQAWKRACYMINQNRSENDIDFTVNTGDIGQSGNRPSEFIDYFQGRSPICDLPEMFTIGNNDLCARNDTVFGNGEDFTSKYNHINIKKYYTFELDPNNIDEDGNSNYYIPKISLPIDIQGLEKKDFTNIPIESVYSYNYGDYHFISLNSEYTAASIIMYNKLTYDSNNIKTATQLVNGINERIENWLKKDLSIWKPNSYHPTDSIYYMLGTKYYCYYDEYGNKIDTIRQLVANEEYHVSNNEEQPGDPYSEEIGKVYFLDPDTKERVARQLDRSDILINEPYDCTKCLVYMHEIPFTIVTDKFIIGRNGREGSKLNTNNNNGLYRYSRLFNRYGIRIVFGGHKHTYCMTRPVVDAPADYLYNGIIYPSYNDTQAGTLVTDPLSRQPVVQYKNFGEFADIESAENAVSTLKDKMVGIYLTNDCIYKSVSYTVGYYLRVNDWQKITITESQGKQYFTLNIPNEGTGLTTRIQLVDKFTYPSYVMSQATGFKLISNKELMTCKANTIPWMLTCCPESNDSTVSSGWKPGRNQLDPMYIVYSLDSDSNTADIDMRVVKNIFTVTGTKTFTATCLMNRQNNTLLNETLFEQTLENV